MKKYCFLLLIVFVAEYSVAQNYPDSQKDGKYYEVNGAKLWTVSHGDGDPLFFIPGGPGGSHPGLRRFDPLSTNNTLVYFDALGRGKSEMAQYVEEYSISRDIEDLEGLRIAMGFDKIAILGHSYGGLVAQGYALKYPENVSHLILANSFHSYLMWQVNCDNSNHEIKMNYPEVWDELMAVREQGVISRDPIHQQIYSQVPYGFLYAYNPEYFDTGKKSTYPNRSNSDVYYQMVGKDGDFHLTSDLGEFDYRTELKNLEMPVLITAGRFDRVAVPSEMVKYKEYCPQAQFEMFEKSGHNPQVEQPELYFKVIGDFLSK